MHSHPFLEIPLDIYEKHMSLASVRQLQSLNMLMKKQLDSYDGPSVMILGVAGGNGLEHVDPGKYDTVYGVDINQAYLDACRVRFQALGSCLKTVCADLSDTAVKLPNARLVIADILVEYIGYEAFVHHMKAAAPDYISVVIQINENAGFVSDSPYCRVFERVSEIHHRIDETGLTDALAAIGYSKHFREESPLPNGKKLVRIDYVRISQRRERRIIKEMFI